MNVGYYFVPAAVFMPDGSAKTEKHWGLFIRQLAKEFGEVTFYAHSGPGTGTETMALGPDDNIRCVDLGPRRARPLMYLLPWPRLRRLRPKADGLDAMLVRGPTALVPAIIKKCRRQGVPAVGLLVDDTSYWVGTTGMSRWRVALVKLWLRQQERAIARTGRTSLMLAISRSAVRDRRFARTAIVPTTSLMQADLTGPGRRTRRWPAAGERVRLLFTGRMALEKGLFELVDALQSLVDDGHNVELELVGATFGDTTLDEVLKRVASADLSDRVINTGFLEAGPPLLAAYDRADVYVLPTYGEGSVTRTIKEAFARGVPVVTTATPQIVEFLEDGRHAVLVEPRNAAALARGIAQLLEDEGLRERMSATAFDWVQLYTNESSAAIVAGHVRDEVARGV